MQPREKTKRYLQERSKRIAVIFIIQWIKKKEELQWIKKKGEVKIHLYEDVKRNKNDNSYTETTPLMLYFLYVTKMHQRT